MHENNVAIADELEDIALQLAMLDVTDTAGSLETISGELQRIEMLSQLLEVPALENLNQWMLSNTEYSNDNQASLKYLLEEGHFVNWIDILAATLREDVSTLITALTSALTEPKWLHPLPASTLKNIINWLEAIDSKEECVNTSIDLEENTEESMSTQSTKESLSFETEKTSYDLFDENADQTTRIDDLLIASEKNNNNDLDILAKLSGVNTTDAEEENSDLEIDIIDIDTSMNEIKVHQSDPIETIESTEIKLQNSITDSASQKDQDNNEIDSFTEEVDNILMTLSSISNSPDDVFENSNKYISELQRLDLLAELSGYSALAKASVWCQKNIELFSQQQSDESRNFIASGECWSWLELSSACIVNPDDISLLPAVSTELMREDWSKPLEMDDLQSLILFLQNPSTETALGDSLENENQALDSSETIEILEETGPTLKWDEDVHPELLAVYFQETPEQVADVAELLQKISQGKADKEQHQHAARIAHTIKGASGVVGITALVQFTHKLEDILDYSVAHKLPEETADLLAEASDCLESLFEAVQEQQTAPEEFLPTLEKLEETANTLAQIENNEDTNIELEMPELPDFITNNNDEDKSNETKEEIEPTKESATNTPETKDRSGDAETNAKNTNVPAFSIPEKPIKVPSSNTESANKKGDKAVTETHVRVPLSIIDKLLNLAGELSITATRVSDQLEKTIETNKLTKQQDVRVHQMLNELSNTIYQQEKGQTDTVTTQQNNNLDSLEMDSYNELHSITGLLTESILDGEEIEVTLGKQLIELSSHLRTQDHLNKELSEVILNSRMVSIDSLIPRLERTVRQTCRKTGKKAELLITGNNINLDTDIINGLTDPLLHLLRNSVDHGIETPETRLENNKEELGTINLDFSQQGNFIVMTLQDNGAGIDPDKIYQRAIDKGLITPEQAFSKDEALKLILLAGFTTQDSISSISGRGVGMDVVKTNVERLKGTMDIESTINEGTSFTIKIPLTLVTSGTLLLKTSGEHIALPIDSIEQLIYLSPKKVISKNGEHYLQHEGKEIHIQALPHLLDWSATDIDYSKAQSIIIVKSNNKIHAVHVDEIISSRELVIKSLAPWLNNVKGIIGACHLADGSVAPVINLPQLLSVNTSVTDTIKNAQKRTQKELFPAQQTPQILVVDDSLSNRKALSLIIEQLDYDVHTAVDGLDALNIINDKHIDMVFTDLEMPRMNGLELTQAIRVWDTKKDLPVVMITSRTTAKHRDLATKAGVDDYLTKPVVTGDLHTALATWLKSKSLV
ncbi:MAG: response regulator [Cocleimonas sp.]